MTDRIENPMLVEHLKRFQAGQERIERKLEEVIVRIGNLEVSVAGCASGFCTCRGKRSGDERSHGPDE